MNLAVSLSKQSIHFKWKWSILNFDCQYLLVDAFPFSWYNKEFIIRIFIVGYDSIRVKIFTKIIFCINVGWSICKKLSIFLSLLIIFMIIFDYRASRLNNLCWADLYFFLHIKLYVWDSSINKLRDNNIMEQIIIIEWRQKLFFKKRFSH